MKCNIFYLTILLFIMAKCCNPDEYKPDNYDYSEEEQALKDSLVGMWVDLPEYIYYGFKYQFTDEDSIFILDTIHNYVWPSAFRIISPDSIEILRCEEFRETLRVNRCKVEFMTADTVRITDFLPNFYDIPYLFDDMVLRKIH